jgi:predicted nucleotidyltransferase
MSESKWKQIAEENTVLRVLVGSQAYGLTTLDTVSDRDEKGVCVEPLEAFAGLHPFEHYEYRTAVERTGKKDAKSGPGDLDLVIYGLRKFLKLALQGNPSIIELLFMEKAIIRTPIGDGIQWLASKIVSKQAGKRFLGYAQAQRQRLLGEIGQKKVNRPELELKYGYDTKYAMHMVRLGLQGVELLTKGCLTLPMEGPDKDTCLAIRTGKFSLNEVLEFANQTETVLKGLLESSELPEYPDERSVETWMLVTYWSYWERKEQALLDTLGSGMIN